MRSEVLVTSFINAETDGQRSIQPLVVALAGGNGQTRWTWRDDGQYIDGNYAWAKVSPQLVRLKEGPAFLVSVHNEARTHAIDPQTGLTPTGKSPDELVLLDGHGKLLARAAIRHCTTTKFRAVQVADMNGDSFDDVAYLGEQNLRVTTGGLADALWEWPLPPQHYYTSIHAVLPAREGHPAELVVDDSLASAVLGFAGRTGKLTWRCNVPQPITSASLLPARSADEPPRAVQTAGTLRSPRR